MTRPKKRIRWTEAVPLDNRVNVPEDIIHDILLLLPIRSLLTCTAVCKSWRSLIQSSAFIHTRLNRTIQSNKQNEDAQLLLINYYSNREKALIFSLHWDNSSSFSEYSKLINPFVADYNQIKGGPRKKYCYKEVVGTCNGLVCLNDYDTAPLIWNPCIRKFVILPPPSVNLMDVKVKCHPNYYKSVYAFGYDSLTNDYKVLRCVGCYHGFRRAVEIWSLSSASWKRLSDDIVPAKFSLGEFTQRHAAFLNGVLHWIHREEEICFIVSFDLSTELFGKILMPEAAVRSKKSYATHGVYVRKEVSDLSRYRDSLAFFEFRQKDMKCVRVHMWVMKEYGVAGSWAKLFTISPQEVVIRALGFRKSGQVVLELHPFGRGGQFCCRSMDPNTKQFEDFRVEGSCTKSYLFMDSFVESIVLLDRPNAISY
ncbi:F-box protein CPR30-like [Prunus avium]|uniref:F-box protein CPR30-like n=1 Tax=Prunus avium TaxID=42229 RepID=A0A6P5TL31_PRUAV|nr:F-box protein CPR30-like [Prunus avium]